MQKRALYKLLIIFEENNKLGLLKKASLITAERSFNTSGQAVVLAADEGKPEMYRENCVYLYLLTDNDYKRG